MIRLILFLVILGLLGLGFSWIADRPGEIVLTWQDMQIETSAAVGLAVVACVAIAAIIFWSILRFIFRLPSLLSLSVRARRRNKGYDALSRGMIAAAGGDRRYALQATREAEKYLGEDPLTLLLRAQSAQLEGDRHLAETSFSRMMERPETRLLGLRGLHAEAMRRGEDEAAHAYAAQAHRIAPLGWATDALLVWHVRRGEWADALDIVDTNRTQKIIARAEADRQRAILLTAQARDIQERDPEEALKQAREASKLAPDLVPATDLAAQLLARRGDMRKATRLLEAAWRASPHPDLAITYVRLRPGDAAKERLARAQNLAAMAPGDLEGALIKSRTALEARDFDLARAALAPFIAGAQTPPTRRICLAMADLEETQYGGQSGPAREWLARAARAPRDPAWIADGIVSDRWEPASPVTGKLDAFRWIVPQDRLSAPQDTLVATPAPDNLAGPEAPVLIETKALEEPEVPHDRAPDPAPAPKPPARPVFTGSALYPMPISPDDPGPDAAEDKPTEERPIR